MDHSGKTSVTSLKVNRVSVTNATEMNIEQINFNNYFATIGPKLASNFDYSEHVFHQKYLTNTYKRFQLDALGIT